MQQIQTLLNRPRYYNNIDGIGELSIGLMLLCFGLLFWMQIHSSLHSLWNQPYCLILFGVAMSLAFHYGIRSFKQKITFPRTGFIRYKATPTWYVFPALASAATVLLITLGRPLLDSANVLGFLFSLLMAGCYGYGVARAVPWKWLVAAAIALSGTAIAFHPAAVFQPLLAGSPTASYLGTRFLVALFPYFLFWSPLFLLSGSISLVLYLRGTHAPAPDAT